nr:hypothetical protein [Tanacetum cinerariifolium]
AIEIATELMDKKILTFVERETASNNHDGPCAPKCHKCNNIGQLARDCRVTVDTNNANNQRAPGGKKQYGGSKPLCAKCNYHHDGPCAPKCHNYNKIGHSASNCRNVANTNNANNQRGTGSGQKSRCHECGVQGHFRRECPKLRNNNN